MPLPVLDNRNSSNATPTLKTTTIWQGTSTDYTNNSNWSNNAPVNGSKVYFGDNSQDCSCGNQKATILREFRVANSYTADISGTISSEIVVFDSFRAAIDMTIFAEEVHVVRAPRSLRLKSGSINKLIVHDTTGLITVGKAQVVNEVIVGKGTTRVELVDTVRTDAPLASNQGPLKTRVGRGNQLTSAVAMNNLTTSSTAVVSKNVLKATINNDGRLITSGSLITTLNLNRGSLLTRDSTENPTLTIANADLVNGLVSTLGTLRTISNTNPMQLLGDVRFRLASGSTADLS